MKILLILLASLCLTGCTATETPEIYVMPGVYYDDEVITEDGNIWGYTQDDISENENVYVLFCDNGTKDNIYDDEICYIAPQTEMGAEIIDSNKLSTEELENRNGKLIIERVIGVVDDAETGAGLILGTEYYISYKRVDGISNGDRICSYFVYNPDTNYIDDIIMRFDYVIGR